MTPLEWAAPPEWCKRVARSVWPQLHVRLSTVRGAGLGLFASVPLPAGLAIPYFGDLFTAAQLVRRGGGAYEIDASGGTVLDARPGGMLARGGMTVAAFANEALVAADYNAVLVEVDAARSSVPPAGHYRLRGAPLYTPRTVLMLKRALREGQEVFAYYGDDFPRRYAAAADYEPGGAVAPHVAPMPGLDNLDRACASWARACAGFAPCLRGRAACDAVAVFRRGAWALAPPGGRGGRRRRENAGGVLAAEGDWVGLARL